MNQSLREAVQNELTVVREIREKDGNRFVTTYFPEPCYQIWGKNGDPLQHYVFGTGFLDRFTQTVQKFGYTPIVEEEVPLTLRDLERLLPDFAAIERIAWRDNQLDIITDMANSFRGQYIAATGSGKSWTMRGVFEVFPKAKILVTTYATDVLKQSWEKMVAAGFDVGLYSSKGKASGGRGMFCSLGSLGRFSDEIWDIVLLDERHEACTLKRIQSLFGVRTRRAYALSAEEEDRADKADKWTEAMFGPVKSRYLYKHAVAQGDIVPVEVEWVNTRIPGRWDKLQPGSVQFERLAVWQNQARNDLIVAKAQEALEKYGQTLIYVSKIEHALMLGKMLNCPIACGSISNEKFAEFRRKKMLPEGFSPASDRERQQLQKDFEKGLIPLAICTSVWRRGVDFPNLRCVVRADASSSVEECVQVSGRVTRKVPGKTVGHVIDFTDISIDALYRRAQNRRAVYKREGFKQR